MDRSVDDLVQALPDVYQPIFGHPEYVNLASRGCEDRLAQLTIVYQALERALGRPLRVLDLGCAQGFFTLSIAALGASVRGVDFEPSNVRVCQALAREHPNLDITFQLGRVQDVLQRLEPDAYDLVLGLSVFHHVVHAVGVGTVREQLSTLAGKTALSLFEFALPDEPQPWAASQPADPRTLLSDFSFVHEVSRNATHLSTISRPLYIASNRFWLLNGEAQAFEDWKAESHVFPDGSKADHCGTRRYYFGSDLIAKLFRLDNDEYQANNIREYTNEVAFLTHPPVGYTIPKLVLHGWHDREAWLVRDRLPGELLVDRVTARTPFDPNAVLRDILNELAALEEAGLYHDDLRLWNVLIGPDGRSTLIDYGALSERDADCAWPHNLFLALIAFVHEVFSANVVLPGPQRMRALSPEGLPEPFRSLFWTLFASAPSEWRFGTLREILRQIDADDSFTPAQPPAGMVAAFQVLADAYAHVDDRREDVQERERRIELLSGELQETREVLSEELRRLRLENARLSPLAAEANRREELLIRNDAATQQAFQELQRLQSDLAELQTALDRAQTGWTAATNESDLIRKHLESERLAAAERLELQAQMQGRIAILEAACVERAKLIDRVTEEAEMLRAVAAERAALIVDLSSALENASRDDRVTSRAAEA